MPRGVDVPPCGVDPALACPQAGDVIAFVQNLGHLHLLLNLAAQLLGMLQQNGVIHGPIDLERCLPPLPLVLGGTRLILEILQRQEFKIPEFRRTAPAKGCANLDGEVGGLHLVPAPHFVEDIADGRELTFTDVIARELFLFQDQHPQLWVVLEQQRPQGAAAGPASDDGNIVVGAACSGGRWHGVQPTAMPRKVKILRKNRAITRVGLSIRWLRVQVPSASFLPGTLPPCRQRRRRSNRTLLKRSKGLTLCSTFACKIAPCHDE